MKAKADSARRSLQQRTRLALALFGIILAALLVVGLTSAANPAEQNLFELDGNAFAQSGTAADWSCLFIDAATNPTPANCASAPVPAASLHKTDPVLDNGDDTLGKGSKDILPLSGWTRVSQKPPAKDDLANAAWANYSKIVDGSPHDFVYFAADRISNNGDAFLGFWFFKDKISVNADGSFSGQHEVGDTLVLVDFIQGNGTKSSSQEIGVYEWDPQNADISGTLKTVVALHAAECGTLGINACAQFNTDTQKSVWPFQSTDSGDLPNFWTVSEFVEGGIDLSSIFPDGQPCFASVMAETRSSDEPTAEQKDIVSGELSTCGTVKIVKDAVPNDPQSFGFTAQDNLLPSPGTFSLVDNGGTTNTKEIPNVKAGTYHVAEDANPPGWQLTGISCDDGTSGDLGTRTVAINVGVSKTVTCTFTNTKTPRLTVNKVCNPATDGGAFNLLVDGNTVKANAACGSTTGAQEYALGTRTVSESQGTNTSLANYTSVFSGDCDATGHVTLAAGDNKTCTITNARNATLTVNKVCVPTTDTGKFNLQIDGATAGTGANASCAGSTGAVVTGAGPHSVGETVGANTSLGDYLAPVFGGACDAQGNVTLAAGDNKVCTITNTHKATLTVSKVCVPSTDTGKFNLRVDGTTVTSDAACGTGTGAQVYSAGSHLVSETAGAGTSLGDYLAAGFGGACDAQGNVTLAAGDNKVCTITNTHKPTLTVNKVCLPTTDAGKFNLQIDGATAGTGANALCGGTTGAVLATIGAHTVGETYGTGTSSSDYFAPVFGGDCAANGSVTLAAGQNAVCTVTNNRKASIAITKTPATQAVDSGGTATFAITVTNTGTVDLTNVTVTDPLSLNCAKVIGPLAAGKSSTYTCTQAGVTAAFTNVATVTAHPPVGSDLTASASANVTVNTPPSSPPPSTPTPAPAPAPTVVDLAIVKTASPTSLVKGGNVTYTLTVTNNGPVTDTAVQVADSLPFGVTYVSSTASQGTCSGTTVVQCAIGTMTNGQKVAITVVVNTTNTGTIVNTTTVVGALPETTLTNNTSSVSINVTAPPVKPAPKPVFKPPVVKSSPPPPPPPPCYAVVVAPKSLTVGKNGQLRLRVTAQNKAIAGVKVEVKGAGILKLSNRTDRAGRVTITLHPKKPGIVLVKPASYKGCANPRIGVLGAFTPPVTG